MQIPGNHFVVEECGKTWKGLINSPITGTDGNHEFLAWIGCGEDSLSNM